MATAPAPAMLQYQKDSRFEDSTDADTYTFPHEIAAEEELVSVYNKLIRSKERNNNNTSSRWFRWYRSKSVG